MIPDHVAVMTDGGPEVTLTRSLILPRRRWWQWEPFAKAEWAWVFGQRATFRMVKVIEAAADRSVDTTQRWIDMGRIVEARAGDYILATEIERPD